MKNSTNFTEATEILYQGEDYSQILKPEASPIYMTTAFTMGDLDDVQQTYDKKGYTYVRTRNPNRQSLGSLISFLEKGSNTLICSSGMAAITTTYFALLNPGDHFLVNENIYGETFDAINTFLKKMHVDVDYVDFDNIDAVKKAIKDNTRIVYTEVVSNPTDHLADISALAEIAHEKNALLMVDNTFTTPIAIKPMTLGADIVISSLTKFMNGHSDALLGSITVKDEDIFEAIHSVRMLTGTSGSPFAAWLVYRGIHTLDLRVRKQMKNAALLAEALEKHPHILHVNHPSLADFSQSKLADKLFKDKYSMTGMLSFEMPDEPDKINAFMNKLNLAHYAPTLGGIRTTLSHPLHSSHHHVPKEDLKKMGISYGLMRVSTGIEDPDDLITDFTQALSVFND